MKKSLVALAVLAASGAALAQVSIKGQLMAGFKSFNHGPVGVVDGGVTAGSSGFGVDTAEVTFSATEDLGGGMKAGASMGLVNVVRGAGTGFTQGSNAGLAGNFGPANSSVYVSGDFGRVTIATARGSDYLTGGVAFVGGTYQDGRALSTRDSSDSVAWSMPMGPVAVSLTYSEPNNYLGLGAGTSGANSGTTSGAVANSQSSIALGLRYTDGPLVADFGYTMYDEGDTATDRGDKSNVRFAGSYDFGAFKLGGGWTQRAGKVGTRTDMGFSAAVPMGALTLGANWVQRNLSDFRDANVDVVNVGYGLSATYALSKRTALIADYTAYTGSNGGVAANNNRDMSGIYNLLLSHSF
jgi:hypothetical protein